MPGRKIPLVTQEIYHVLNRGVASQPTFLDWRDFNRGLETTLYYQNLHLPFKYSFSLTQAREKRLKMLDGLRRKRKFLVEIIAYCLMPNHFHLLLKQLVDGGISKFLSNLTNSYTRYFNTRYRREGVLFQGKFKAVRIESDEQLWHLSRYIHLNPYSSYAVKTLKDLINYRYSSLPEYLGRVKTKHCQKEIVLAHFRSKASYQKFIFDQANYQRELEKIKHLVMEK